MQGLHPVNNQNKDSVVIHNCVENGLFTLPVLHLHKDKKPKLTYRLSIQSDSPDDA